MATPFDAELSRIADLSDEELAALEESLTAEFEKADQAGDEQMMSDLADALDLVLTEKQRRGGGGEAAPAPAEAEQPMAAAADTPETAEAEVPAEDVVEETAADEETEEDEADEAESAETAEADEVEEEQATTEDTPVAEADESAEANTDDAEGTAQVTVTQTAPPEVPEDHKPLAASAALATVVAGADIPGTPAGTVFSDRRSMTKAYADRLNTLRRLTGGDGEQVIIASVRTETDEAHTLLASDPEGNSEKIRRATDPFAPKSLTAAAGDGWCAPLTTRYEIFGMGDTDRPVRDSLPGFNADRGGIRYFPGFSLADVAGAIGIWDSSKDPSVDTKPVGTVACPTEQTCEIYAVTRALQFTNVAARVFPELIDAAVDLAMVAQARTAESNLLAGIKTASTALAGPTQTVGTIRQILHDVGLVAAYYRDRARLAPETPMRTILPSWIIEAVRADVSLTGQDKNLIEGLTVAEINAFFASRNINVTWALDSAVPGTNGGGFYAAAVTNISDTPSTVEYPMFVEGSFVLLDGGTLDLGIVRDSTLVSSNEFMQFAETFEGLCNVGGPSLWITSNVDITGQFIAGTQTTITSP